jgi:hypothetical protein
VIMRTEHLTHSAAGYLCPKSACLFRTGGLILSEIVLHISDNEYSDRLESRPDGSDR